MSKITLPFPDTQIGFAQMLEEIRSVYLQDSLASAISLIDIQEIDGELHKCVDNESLQAMAQNGMRGELLFAVPCILRKKPQLLGYYRLLLGYSQKEFYTRDTGAGVFKSMEEKGRLNSKQEALLVELCIELNKKAKYMLERIEARKICASLFDQLTLLTLGPQLRGGNNVQKGTKAITLVFDIIYKIVESAIIQHNKHEIVLMNNSHRKILIKFAADPDIVIQEELKPGQYKNKVAIEVKGGKDYSNIHNRIGEAEKSHQKAKKEGYVECWTVVNVGRMDQDKVRRESPTTNRFYTLADLSNKTSKEYEDFMCQILSNVGL